MSKHGTDATDILSHEDLRSMGTSLPFYLVAEIKSLQLHLKHLQEEGLYSIDDSFDCSHTHESLCFVSAYDVMLPILLKS